MLANFHKQMKKDVHTLIPVLVSPQFYDVIGGKNVYLISFGKPNATLYLIASHQKYVLTYFHTKKVTRNFNNIPNWNDL